MKKKYLSIAALLLSCVMLSACGDAKSAAYKKGQKMAEEALSSQLADAGEKDTALTPEQAKTSFSDAFNKSSGEKNSTIYLYTRTDIGVDENLEAATSEQTTNENGEPAAPVEGSEKEYSVSRVALKQNLTDEKSLASFSMENESSVSGGGVTKGVITGYYDGELLYFYTKTDETSNKIKGPISYEDFYAQMNNFSLAVYEGAIENAYSTEDGKNIVYNIKYDPKKLNDEMKKSIESSGTTLEDEQNMEINYSHIIATVDKQSGNMIDYTFVMDAKYINGESKIPYVYSINCQFADFGKTEVEEVQDPENYTDSTEQASEAETEDESFTADEVIDLTEDESGETASTGAAS